jgi:hypothetical protein
MEFTVRSNRKKKWNVKILFIDLKNKKSHLEWVGNESITYHLAIIDSLLRSLNY